MIKELFEKQPALMDSKRTAFSIFPDLYLTKVGPYKRSSWRNFADRNILFIPDMEDGLTIENYHRWLIWNYTEFSKNAEDNPITHGYRDLKAFNPHVKALWTMSFTDKGFELDETHMSDFFRFTKIRIVKEDEDFIIEREMIMDRFGNEAIVERFYHSEDPNNLVQMVTLTREGLRADQERLIAKLDDTERWDYQQWYTTYVVGLHEELKPAFNQNISLLEYFSELHFIKTFDSDANFTYMDRPMTY